MKLRHKQTGQECSGDRFVTSTLDYITIYYPEEPDEDRIRNFDVWLEQSQQWKDLGQAFTDHDLITDNYNTQFFEPPTPEDRERGYTL